MLHLTTSQLHDAITRHIDESKPDPLAKNQMASLHLSWESSPQMMGDDVDHQLNGGGGSGDADREAVEERESNLRGTLTLSSDYVSIFIHVMCRWKTNTEHVSSSVDGTKSTSSDKQFQNEFYFRLTTTASFVPLSGYNNNSQSNDDETTKVDRKDKAAKRKLRAGMVKRLSADSLIRRLLVESEDGTLKEKDNTATVKGVPLCEALIQSNGDPNYNITVDNASEVEERVNVNTESVEGIRNAILTHCEDNLDVLELLLSMPYLPRHKFDSVDKQGDVDKQNKATMSMLAERAYLRLLEDAMYDACEKEGEDEMLDNLNISDKNEDESSVDSREEESRGKSKRCCGVQGKRAKR